MQVRLKHRAEYVLLRGVTLLFQVLPYLVCLGLAWCIARILFHVVRFRVVAAEQRIREVFGEGLSSREVRSIAWTSMRNMCFNAVEVIRIPSMTLGWMKGVTDHEAVHRIRDASAGRGGIIVVPHMGSWDMGAVSVHMLGLPAFNITRRQNNPLMDDYLNRMRVQHGMDVVYRGTFELREVLRRLKKKGVLMMTPDVRSATPETPIHFLGVGANISPGTALMAKMANVPIWPAVVTREGWGRHRWQSFEPIYPDPERSREEDLPRMMQEVFDVFDQAIRKNPEQYFWYNKRWVLEPLGEIT